jgi:hypothetical protein
LADLLDLQIEPVDGGLLSGGDLPMVFDWLRVLPEHSVLCTHDKVITKVTEILTRQRAGLDGRADFSKAKGPSGSWTAPLAASTDSTPSIHRSTTASPPPDSQSRTWI